MGDDLLQFLRGLAADLAALISEAMRQMGLEE